MKKKKVNISRFKILELEGLTESLFDKTRNLLDL